MSKNCFKKLIFSLLLEIGQYGLIKTEKNMLITDLKEYFRKSAPKIS
jgi:hypothetical protein